MKLVLPALAALVLSLASTAIRDGVQDSDPCDLSRVEDGLYCLRCRKVLRNAPRAEALDKEGRCRVCGLAPERVRVCLKEWVPKCGMHDMKPHDKPCCTSPTCCRVDARPAPVHYACESCGATGGFEDRIVHRKGCIDRKARPVCEESGRFPHGGRLPAPKPPPDDEPQDE